MRKRVIRDLGTIAGVVVILAVIVLVNGYVRRGSLAEQMIKFRQNVEKVHSEKGASILPWDIMRKTKGTRKTGPTFTPELLEHKDNRVSVVGFMTPLYEFRNTTEFLFLPMPIECYFCESPPMRDVILVQMAEGKKVDLVEEPVLLDATLALNEGPGTKFFYVMKDAVLSDGQQLTPKKITPQHLQEGLSAKQAEQASSEPLLEPQEPPATAGADASATE